MIRLLQRIKQKTRRQWRRRRALALFRRSGLFDAAWYAKAYSDVATSGMSAADHYLYFGGFEGRRPHPLFDSGWYLERNSDVADTGQNPLLHYLMAGDAEGRDPNPYFAARWYRAQNPDTAGYISGLTHFLKVGAAAGRDPSPLFDIAWYAAANPERGGLDPLSHFLTIGLAERRKPSALGEDTFDGDPVGAARMRPFKRLAPVAGRPVALMVAHAPGGRLKPNVGPYVEALSRTGMAVVLIAATDAPFAIDPEIADHLAGGFVRENRGFDFAAWAHVLRSEPELFAVSSLLLVNDSVIGPCSQAALEQLLARAQVSPAAVVGATDSREFNWHLQSYFLLLKAPVLASFAFHHLIGQVRSLDEKDHVIRAYELTFTPRLEAAGLPCEAVFKTGGAANSTVAAWRELLRAGFPFVKASALNQPGARDGDWREVLAEVGFDADAVEAAADAALAPPPGALDKDWPLLAQSEATVASDPLKVIYVGPWNYASGLGSASRGYLSAWWRAGVRLHLMPIERPFHVHAHVAPTVTLREFEDDADVAVVHLNPDGWALLTPEQKRLIARARKRIGLFVWEMDAVPDSWVEPIRSMDAVWAPSRYCADAFAKATSAPVSVVPHVTPTPPPADGRRRAESLAALGLPAEARLILYAFDGASYVVRKNPHALIRAFAASGLAARGWRLVLKTKNLMDQPTEGARLRELAEGAAGVELIDRSLSGDAMAALFEAADVYASPHRAEGFGLTIAEAMAMGKIVVATDYSGSTDFLDATCGLPVPAVARPLDRGQGHYLKGGVWADIDEAALTEALQAAAARVEAGDHTLGQAARARIAERLSADAVAAAIRRGLSEALAGAEPRPA